MSQENYNETIKSQLKADLIVIGTEVTLKGIKTGKISRVYVSKNAPQAVRDDIKHYSDLEGTEIIDLEMFNDELGTLCKKHFPISVLGVKKKSDE